MIVVGKKAFLSSSRSALSTAPLPSPRCRCRRPTLPPSSGGEEPRGSISSREGGTRFPRIPFFLFFSAVVSVL